MKLDLIVNGVAVSQDFTQLNVSGSISERRFNTLPLFNAKSRCSLLNKETH